MRIGEKMLHNYIQGGCRIPVGYELYCLGNFPKKTGTGRILENIPGMPGCKNGDWCVDHDVIINQSDCRRVFDDFGGGHTEINKSKERSVSDIRNLAKCRRFFSVVSESTVHVGFGTKTFENCQQHNWTGFWWIELGS